MPAPARAGFQRTEDGILYWFLDAEGVANLLGPIVLLEQVEPNAFILNTSDNHRYHVRIDAEQLADYRRFGGNVRDQGTVSSVQVRPAELPWGFQRTHQGLFLWYSADAGTKHIGPILALQHVQGDKYVIVVKEGRHSIRLSPQKLAEFRILGGTMQQRPEIVSATEAVQRPPVARVLAHEPSRELAWPASQTPQVIDYSPIQVRFGTVGWGPTAPTTNSAQRHPLIWRGVGKSLQVGQYAIQDPLVYYSDRPPAIEEASCIDRSLPVGHPVAEPKGALGYWPEYRRISPNQRASYLAWLAGGRRGELHDIGYAFIYFYGLERRVLLENQDLNPVIEEVVRLLQRYTFSGSFTGYLTRFLAYIIARTGLEKLRKEWFEFLFRGVLSGASEELLSLALAWHVKRQQTLSPKWAFRMAKQHPRAAQSVVVQRAAEQMQALFAKKYEDRIGPGFMLQGSRRDRAIEYRQPASPSLLNLKSRNPALADSVCIPNALGLQSQFLPLVKIWDECIEELKPLSRRLGAGHSVDTREVFEALPDELKEETDHPDKSAWDRVAAELAAEDGFIGVPIAKLAEIQGIGKRKKLTLKQSKSLADTAHWVGYSIEPDTRLTMRTYSWDDTVAVFRPDGEATLPQDHRYISAAMILETGVSVAAADGTVTQEEMAQIGQFVEEQFRLDCAEARRLKQLKQLYVARPPALSGVAKSLRKTLSQEQRETVGRFLVGLAAANGEITKPMLKSLRNAYRVMKLEVTHLNRLLDELKPATDTAVAPPGPSSSGDARTVQATHLNQDLIRQIMVDTNAVAEMLGQAFQEEDETDDSKSPPAVVCTTTPGASAPPAEFAGLPERFVPVLQALLERATLAPDAFDALVRAWGLLPADTMSRINEWAETEFGDTLIEEGDPLIIRQDLIRAKA
jgi:uncharacterized tellurite resistance protein B-like protein